MAEKQDGSNLNRGGNWGNVYGAGAPKRDFRIEAGKAALKRLSHWIKVANGNKVIAVPGFGKAKPTLRYPTHDEQERAFKDILLRYGIGTQDEVVVLQSLDVLNALADVLPEFVEDPDVVDAILVAVESRIGGNGT